MADVSPTPDSPERTWEMYGHAADNGVWVVVGPRPFVHLHGYDDEPVPVLVSTDPCGDYMGWLDARPEAGVDHTDPHFIQHHKIFDVQFPYGHKAEMERGRGTALRLRIEVRDV